MNNPGYYCAFVPWCLCVLIAGKFYFVALSKQQFSGILIRKTIAMEGLLTPEIPHRSGTYTFVDRPCETIL